jgi:hypothetical protein
MSQSNGDYVLPPGVYNFLKRGATVVLPALAALYFGLAAIWGLPKADEVVGTIAVINTFIGAVVTISSVSYNNSEAKYDGVINVTQNPDGTANAELNLKNYENPADVVAQPEALFKVNRQL